MLRSSSTGRGPLDGAATKSEDYRGMSAGVLLKAQ